MIQLLFHKAGLTIGFMQVLETALKDQDLSLDGSNQHLFNDKKARYDAMNSLASNYFMLHEIENQKVQETPSDQQSIDLYTKAMKLSNDMTMLMFDV